MVLKIISAVDAKTGTNILVEGEPCVVKKNDISRPGKHGHAKCRIEAVGLVRGNKKVLIIPGHDKLDVPHVDKRKGQILSVGEKASVMDLENFETIEMDIPEEFKGALGENDNIEYWDVEGTKLIKRKI